MPRPRFAVWVTVAPLLACTFDATGLGASASAIDTGSASGELTSATTSSSSDATTQGTATTTSASLTGTSDATLSSSGVDPSETVGTSDPSTTGTTDPSTTDPSTTDPSTTDPSTSDPSTSTTSDTTTTTGGDELLFEDGLVVRYYLDEADKGQLPKLAVDAAPQPLDLPLIYASMGGPNPIYGGGPEHRGLKWPSAGLDGRATIPIAGTKAQSGLVSRTAATIEVVVDLIDVTTNGSRIVHIGGGAESGWLTLRTSNKLKAQTYWQGESLAGVWDFDWDKAGRVVVHVVYDSMEADPVDRVRFYADGVERADAADMVTAPTLAQQIAIPDVSQGKAVHLTLGNRGEDIDRSFAGTLHYAAIYNVALDPAAISHNAAILAGSDDTP